MFFKKTVTLVRHWFKIDSVIYRNRKTTNTNKREMLSSEAMEPCDLPPQGSMKSAFPLVQTHCKQTVYYSREKRVTAQLSRWWQLIMSDVARSQRTEPFTSSTLASLCIRCSLSVGSVLNIFKTTLGDQDGDKMAIQRSQYWILLFYF